MMIGKHTMIFPDIHLRVEQAEKIIKHVCPDEVIFLGDYFDDFGDDPPSITEACTWLEYSVKQPNRIHLFGNHDLHYAYANRCFQCSGFADWKYWHIQDNLDRSVWDKLRHYYFLDDTWLLSHAGLHKLNLPKDIRVLYKDRKAFHAAIDKFLAESVKEGFQKNGGWIFRAGAARWGTQRVGGITWCDFNREFHPIRGLNQIFGHTPQMQEARWCFLGAKSPISIRPCSLSNPLPETIQNVEHSVNLCLDVHRNTSWAIWDGKEIKVFNYLDEM